MGKFMEMIERVKLPKSTKLDVLDYGEDDKYRGLIIDAHDVDFSTVEISKSTSYHNAPITFKCKKITIDYKDTKGNRQTIDVKLFT